MSEPSYYQITRDDLSRFERRIERLREIDRVGLEIVLQQEVVVIQHFAELRREPFTMEQVDHAHGAARDLVFVRRADAATRGADRAVLGAARRTGGHRAQVLMANLDQMVVVQSVAEPAPQGSLVDRLLVGAASQDVPAVVCLNKIDLAPYVGASLDVMERDATRMRAGRPAVCRPAG